MRDPGARFSLDALNICARCCERTAIKDVSIRVMEDSLLLDLIGEELGSVVFVRDYVQLVFDGPYLSLYVWPVVTTADGRTSRFGDEGYRDALCGFIGLAPTSIVVDRERGIELVFGDAHLTINPPPEEIWGPGEIAMLGGFTGRPDWDLWRTDTYPFDQRHWD